MRADAEHLIDPIPLRGSGYSEPALIQLALDGDVDAFARVFERYRTSLHGVCSGILRDPALADDIVQETFLRGLKYLHTYDTERGIWPWLMRIAVRESLRTVGRRRRDEAVGDAAEVIAALQASDVVPDDICEQVLRLQDLSRIEKALADIPARQRRALLLYALEGWSYPEIAAAHGTSVLSVKSLIFRARAAVRERCAVGATAILLPWHSLRARANRASDRVRIALGQFAAQSSLAGSTQNFGAGLLVLALSVGTATTPVAPELDAPAPAEAVAGAFGLTAPPARDPSTAAPLSHELLGRFTTPPEKMTADKTYYTSVEHSPNYQRDHTIFALGRAMACVVEPCTVLYRTTDGGASWGRIGAPLMAHTLVLPPNYPEDDRLFAMGPDGLHESADGGETFDLVAPIVGSSAISPAFHRGDPRVLINSGPVMEYWADKHLVKPALLTAPSAMHTGAAFTQWQTVAFSPAYPAHDVVLVSGILPSGVTAWESHQAAVVYRCEAETCAPVRLPGTIGLVSLAVSPRFADDGLVFAYRDDRIYRSEDGGVAFRRLPLPGGNGEVMDLRVVASGGQTALFAAVRGELPTAGGVYRSLDGGRTWQGARIPVPGFEEGAFRVEAAPDGRLIAGGILGGIACSVDGGLTWAARCPGA